MTPRILLAAVLLGCLSACWSEDRLPAPKTLYETSFEEGDGLPTGWTVDFGKAADFAWADNTARTGKRSVHITDNSEEQSAGIRSPKIAVSPGDRVWVRGWYRAAKTEPASIYIEFWDANGKRMDKAVKSFVARSSGDWQEAKGTHTVPEGATHATVLLYCWSKGTCDGYFDDIRLGAGFQPTHDRTPRPPAKVEHPCGPYSREDIERAKKNVEKHDWAKAQLNSFKRSSEFWMDMPDDQIKQWVPELTPFRVCDCPNCDALWAICWSHLADGRFKCRKCGTEYPNEKFPEMKTEVLLSPTGKRMPHTYYENAKGKKYRLSGKSRFVRVGQLNKLGDMGRCYALTGDKAYAEKAVKVMRRLAEVYPDYVPHDWYNIYEDYGNTQSGKLSGWKLYDCTTMLEVCLCYDLIYDGGALTEEDKVAIENRVFRELGEMLLPIPQCGCCINDGPFQMSAAAYLGVVLGDHRLVKWAVEPPGGFIGFVRDYFFRDGHWEDGSPSYESMALGKFYLLPEIIQGYSDPPEYAEKDRYDKLDVLSDPLIRKIHVAPLYNMFPDRTLPPINDSCMGCGYSARHAEVNQFWYPIQHNLEIMNWVYRGKIDETGSEYALWRRDPDQKFADVKELCLSENSIIRPGLGWAILREGEGDNRTDLVLDYGEPCGWHGHPDRLNVILWANGREVVTDLGYLGARHHFRPWMAHGICHNLVMVDGKDQAREPGKLIVFQPGDCVQAVVAEAPKTYPQCSRYERSVLLITPAPGVQYVADVFRVAGGAQHDFSFHGDGAIFDCPAIANAKPFEGEIGPKEGGYDWLEDVRTAAAKGEVIADWQFGEQDAKAADVGVRLRMLDASGTLINAKGPNLRNQRTPYLKPMLDYVIQRRPGPINTFVSVIEPFRGKPTILSAARLPIQKEGEFDAVAIQVAHAAGTDYVILSPDATRKTRIAPDEKTTIELAGRLGVAALDKAGDIRFLWLAEGTSIRCNEMKIETEGTFSGRIIEFDEGKATFAVDAHLPDGRALHGQPIIAQKRVDGAYTVDGVERAANGSLVHLQFEPIMKVEKGEEFRLPTYGFLSRRAVDRDAGMVAYRAALAAPGRVALMEARGLAYLRGEGDPWKKVAVENGSVPLAPKSFKGNRALLILTNEKINLQDTDPPTVRSVTPSPRSQERNHHDLGFLRGRDIAISLADVSGLGQVEACLQGGHAGRLPVAVKVEERGALVQLGDLPEDRFTLDVEFADRLGNNGRAVMTFQTMGFIQNFTEMKIVEGSGQDSKPLPELETQFYRGKASGDFVVYEFPVSEEGEYQITLVFTQAPSYGTWQFSIDGKKIGDPVDGYASEVIALGGKARLGTMKLAPGPHRIRVEVVGRNDKATHYLVGLGRLLLRPE